MLDKTTEVSKKLFTIAKRQYENNIISQSDYLEILEILLEKISSAELEYGKKDFINNALKNPLPEINLRDTIEVAFALN